MSLTVSGQSQYLYNNYTFKNSSAYSKYSVDTSGVSQENYNVSNLTNALDAMDKSDSADFSSISNIDSYAKNSFKLSQLDSYDKLSSSSNITRMLTGEAGADDIYSLMETENEIKAANALSSVSSTSSSAASDYSSYLAESGSIVNLLI